MRFKKILVPVDGSDSARHAVEVAKDLFGDNEEVTIHLITVVSAGSIATELQLPYRSSLLPAIAPGVDSYNAMIESVMTSANERLEEGVGNLLEGVACQVVTDTIVSNKAQAGIVDYAKEKGCQMIIMGRRGLGSLRGMVVGSVSYGVLHEAEIPVLTVR